MPVSASIVVNTVIWVLIENKQLRKKTHVEQYIGSGYLVLKEKQPNIPPENLSQLLTKSLL